MVPLMRRDLQALANQAFDLLVIGGGITGAGIARDAALRGLRVALVEKADFASGTSSRSTKLIHGGFRYLEQGAFGLVHEACRERRILQDIAPQLVKPVAFLLVVYDGDARPLWKVRLGMTLYDLLAAYRNPGRHETLAADRARKLEPALAVAGLRGAVKFYDCQEDDARFCMANILQAADCGAVCANYCEVTGFDRQEDRIVATRVRDVIGGAAFVIRARVVVNAAGPWVEQVDQLAPLPGTPLRLSVTKGVHLVVPRLTSQFGLFFQARRDRRLIFIVPWLEGSIIGSTDTDFRGDPAAAATDDADIEYLLGEVNTLLPGRNLTPAAIVTTFAGVRPLLASGSDPSARSREHQIQQRGTNLLSIAGGKYTTYRSMAAEAVEAVGRCLDVRLPGCLTATTPLPDFRPAPGGEQLAAAPLVYESDIRHACEHEMAVRLSDVMRRRTLLALTPLGGEALARRVAAIMMPLRGWDESETERQVQQYLAERNGGTL